MRFLVLICLVTLGLASIAEAQSRITPEEFLARAQGKTLDFHDEPSGALVGREYFISPRETIWQPAYGDCVRGEVTTPDGQLCFRYEDRPDRVICWVPFEFKGRLLVRMARLTNAQVQEVRREAKEALSCGMAPMS